MAAHQAEFGPDGVGYKGTMQVLQNVEGQDSQNHGPLCCDKENLQHLEAATEEEQAHDLKIKKRVRIAKFVLRSVNLVCSLIVLSMLSATLSIFHATRSLPATNGFPAWATNANSWPQKVVLAAACVSLAFSLAILVAYCRGGHRRAEKISTHYTLFAIAWFVFSMVMWGIALGVLQYTHKNSGNQDLWGWSCAQNKRSELFSQRVNYTLVCRLQDWSLVCMIIEIVLEVMNLSLYGVILYRFFSKRRLLKVMNMHTKARLDQNCEPKSQFQPCEDNRRHTLIAPGEVRYPKVAVPNPYTEPPRGFF